jgi:hypothetical protein
MTTLTSSLYWRDVKATANIAGISGAAVRVNMFSSSTLIDNYATGYAILTHFCALSGWLHKMMILSVNMINKYMLSAVS